MTSDTKNTGEKHTPGPWTLGAPQGQTGPTTPSFKPFCGGEDWPYEQVTVGQETVAVVPAPDDGGPFCCGNPIREQAEANARLIAAAPELLEALDAARNALLSTEANRTNGDAIAKVEAAIARATGAA